MRDKDTPGLGGLLGLKVKAHLQWQVSCLPSGVSEFFTHQCAHLSKMRVLLVVGAPRKGWHCWPVDHKWLQDLSLGNPPVPPCPGAGHSTLKPCVSELAAAGPGQPCFWQLRSVKLAVTSRPCLWRLGFPIRRAGSWERVTPLFPLLSAHPLFPSLTPPKGTQSLRPQHQLQGLKSLGYKAYPDSIKSSQFSLTAYMPGMS